MNVTRCQKPRSSRTAHLACIFNSTDVLPPSVNLVQCKALRVKSQFKWEVCASIPGQNISLINTVCDSVICVSDILLNSPSAGCCCSSSAAARCVLWLLLATMTVHCSDRLTSPAHTQLHYTPVLYNLILSPCIFVCVIWLIIGLNLASSKTQPLQCGCCSHKYRIFCLFPVKLIYDTLHSLSNSILNKTENLKLITWMINPALQHCLLLFCKK